MIAVDLPAGRLRTVRPDDIYRLGELDAYVQQLHHDAHPEIWKAPDVAASVAFFDAQLGAGNATIVVSQDDDGEAVGYVLFNITDKPESSHKPARRVLDLEHLAVGPQHQRNGRARELLEWVDRYAVDNGCHLVELSVWQFNDRAISVYERQGFAHVSQKMMKRPLAHNEAN